MSVSMLIYFVFKQKTAYEMRISVWSSDVCSSDLDDVPCGDLPADGTYYHNGKTFVPVGFGHVKPRRPDVDRDSTVYLLIKALLDGTPIPQECRNWCDWYEKYNR